MTADRGGHLGIGVELRDARLARGVTIDDAQRATRISRRYLEALEAEDFAALPAPVFARGFLRSYAQFLGIDPTELVSRFPGEPRPADALPDVSQFSDAPRRRITGRDRAGAGPEALMSEDRLDPIPEIDMASPNVRLGPWLVAGFVVLAVLAGVVAIVTIGDNADPIRTPTTTTPGVPAGPAAGELQTEVVAAAPTILLDFMPELTDRTVSDAIVVLRRSGLPFVIVEIYDPNTPVGAVLDQTPAPGVSLDTGTSVTLVVSRGRQITEAPPTAPEDDAALDATSPDGTDEVATDPAEATP